MEVIVKERKSAVLTPSDLPCLQKVCSVNISAGCAQGCAYCYARSYSQAPGEGKVVFYANTVEKLKAEWPRKRKTPDRVYFCPSSDLFQPIPEILDAAYEMMAFILAQGAGVALTTKGRIPERHMELLLAHQDQVHVQAGLITHNDMVRKVLEPYAAPVAVRVAQAKRLRVAGVAVKLRIAPIIPSITDNDETFSALCRIAKDCGIDDIVINVLHLRPSIRRSLQKKLPDAWLKGLWEAYEDAEPLKIGGRYGQTPLSLDKRKTIFANAKRCCEEFGLKPHICGCMNPDLAQEQCFLAGDKQVNEKSKVQMELF